MNDDDLKGCATDCAKPDRADAALGALLGALSGDASGATLEFLGRRPSPEEVTTALSMVGGGVWGTAPGQVTDDGELTMALAQALVGTERYDRRRVAENYRRWYLSRPFDIGRATSNALGVGEPGNPELADVLAGAARHLNSESQANGSLMRASALGVWSARVDVEEASLAARSDAALTHPHPVCGWAGAAYVVAIRYLVLHPGDAEGAMATAVEVLRAPEAIDVLEWIGAARRGDLPSCHPNAGHVRIAFIHAFHHLNARTPYLSALRSTLSLGGDTDTNACIVGGLVGALHGARGIPEPMLRAVLECDTSLGRPRPGWLSTRSAEMLASRLTD